jgi:hypothetical protein
MPAAVTAVPSDSMVVSVARLSTGLSFRSVLEFNGQWGNASTPPAAAIRGAATLQIEQQIMPRL